MNIQPESEQEIRQAAQSLLNKLEGNLELGKWVNTIPIELFDIILSMKRLTWADAAGRKYTMVERWIDDIVFSRLDVSTIKELRSQSPKSKRGNSSLNIHIIILLALAKASGYNWNNWHRMIQRVFHKI